MICIFYFIFLGASPKVKFVISAPGSLTILEHANTMISKQSFCEHHFAPHENLLLICFVKFENTFPSCVLIEMMHIFRIIVWNSVADPDPHYFGIWIQIRNRAVEGCGHSQWRPWRLKMESWRVTDHWSLIPLL
jgi:hypothetical protein